MQTLYRHEIESPIGTLLAATNKDGALCLLSFSDHQDRFIKPHKRFYPGYTIVDAATPTTLASALHDYFNGIYNALDSLDIATCGSPFQQHVWAILRTLPAGIHTYYSTLALQSGGASYARAVGNACASNPIALVIPCHRVVGKEGELKQYAWGIERKAWLLQHESAHVAPSEQQIVRR
jgi:methylated-DNA-[protein]-cysteine S-methyltransferase